ncbi:MAG TPA: pilin [Candidatus Saccharimonadales bacterium]|jgi:hypothetical protein
MQQIKNKLQLVVLGLVAMIGFTAAAPFTPTADAACTRSVFTFPVWADGLPGTCKDPQIRKLDDFWVVALNLIEVLIKVVLYVAAGFVVWGGFKYIKSEGEPAKISEAKMAIIYALIGLGVALSSIAIVDYIQARILQ